MANYYMKTKQNEHYHKTIINNMKEIEFLNNAIYEKTDNYRAYRHLWRHNYTHRLKETEISLLAVNRDDPIQNRSFSL